ncbi:MAG TPA: PAS domain-containing sensor histidine kinase [Candidatus Acidoferrales bacterium]|nr:PAS domain-containing sensor histidine kinase [Candidatus Acidoferrales bacterium]
MESLIVDSEHFGMILNAVQTGILMVDATNHRITYANPVSLQVFGRPKEEVVGSVCHNVVCPAEKGKCPITDLGLAIDNTERAVINARGERVPVIKTVVPTTIDGRKYLIESFVDIRERKQTEQRLLNERVKAIEQLAGMVVHDLRNPLQGILSAVGVLKGNLNDSDETAKEMIQLIEKNVEYSGRLIRDLSECCKGVQLEKTSVDIKPILLDALSFVTFPNNIKLVDFTEDQVLIDADSGKLKRVFVNLLKNAVEAMPNGGTLTLTSKKFSGNVEIIFGDTGVGMTEDVMKNIWMPLFTTKSEGMGFGLAICKKIVEAHGGSVKAESLVGKGSTITVSLPLSKIS